MTEIAAMSAQFRMGLLLSFLTLSLTPSMLKIEISSGRTSRFTQREMKYRIPSTTTLRKSKSRSRLAMVMGANYKRLHGGEN